MDVDEEENNKSSSGSYVLYMLRIALFNSIGKKKVYVFPFFLIPLNALPTLDYQTTMIGSKKSQEIRFVYKKMVI